MEVHSSIAHMSSKLDSIHETSLKEDDDSEVQGPVEVCESEVAFNESESEPH